MDQTVNVQLSTIQEGNNEQPPTYSESQMDDAVPIEDINAPEPPPLALEYKPRNQRGRSNAITDISGNNNNNNHNNNSN